MLKWASLLGVGIGIEWESGGCCMSDPLDSCLAWSLTLATNTGTDIPAVTQHWANKDRHSTDIEKYSRRIIGDESDPLCLSLAWYAGENTD